MKALAASALASIMLNSCVTYVADMDVKYAEKAKQHIVEDTSKLGKLFLENNEILLKDEKWAQKEIEALVEENYSIYLDKKIDFPSPHFKETGNQLVLTKRGSIDVESMKLYYNQKLSRDEIKAIEYLAERVGTKKLKKNDKSEKFKELVKIFEKDEMQLLNDYDKKYSLPEPEYSAYMMGIGGYALDLLIYYYIRMDEDAYSLYGSFVSQAHEYTHTMIYNDMTIGYAAHFLFAYLNWNNNKEVVPIHETACDVVADRVAGLFIENSLEKDSELYKRSVKLREYFANSDEYNQSAVAFYKSFPEEDRLDNRDEILEAVSEHYFKKSGVKKYFNEARLALFARYSGSDARPKLEHLLDSVGPDMFLQLVPFMYYGRHLDIIQQRVDAGNKELYDIVNPIAVEQCPVKPYEITF
ncbi:MAG: hypothetical protein ABIB71_02930 [Candidatus Woesearchaeota archaeon]